MVDVGMTENDKVEQRSYIKMKREKNRTMMRLDLFFKREKVNVGGFL